MKKLNSLYLLKPFFYLNFDDLDIPENLIGSHLDWTSATRHIHYNRAVEWPESKEMINAGFSDSHRDLHRNPLLDPGLTWGIRAAAIMTSFQIKR